MSDAPPPTPHRDALRDELAKLHDAAGKPSGAVISQRANALLDPTIPRIGRQRPYDWISGQAVPQRPQHLRVVVQALTEMAARRRRSDGHLPPGPSNTLHWEHMRRLAAEEPPPRRRRSDTPDALPPPPIPDVAAAATLTGSSATDAGLVGDEARSLTSPEAPQSPSPAGRQTVAGPGQWEPAAASTTSRSPTRTRRTLAVIGVLAVAGVFIGVELQNLDFAEPPSEAGGRGTPTTTTTPTPTSTPAQYSAKILTPQNEERVTSTVTIIGTAYIPQNEQMWVIARKAGEAGFDVVSREAIRITRDGDFRTTAAIGSGTCDVGKSIELFAVSTTPDGGIPTRIRQLTSGSLHLPQLPRGTHRRGESVNVVLGSFDRAIDSCPRPQPTTGRTTRTHAPPTRTHAPPTRTPRPPTDNWSPTDESTTSDEPEPTGQETADDSEPEATEGGQTP